MLRALSELIASLGLAFEALHRAHFAAPWQRRPRAR